MHLIVKQSVVSFTDPEILRVMSYNIRMAPCIEDDGTENAWAHRFPKINMIFDQYKPDIIGIQELSSYQLHCFENTSYAVSYKFLSRYPTKGSIKSGLGIFITYKNYV